jgi:hypothetical protein
MGVETMSTEFADFVFAVLEARSVVSLRERVRDELLLVLALQVAVGGQHEVAVGAAEGARALRLLV